MLRFIESANAAQARSYYTEGLSREDYYIDGQETAGRWRGKGATKLGLGSEMKREAFAAMCDNIHPTQPQRLTPRSTSNRRVGYDINFHAPKSVSVIHALTGDGAILEAFRHAVDDTMTRIEREMKTRVRIGGQSHDRLTGNMVWGEFIHFTARPMEGHPDPHLHAHCFAFNATHDPIEDRWKAGQFGDLKADAPYFEAAFHATLADRLRDIGYRIERTGKGWELAGVPASVIKKFSRRTDEIERLAEEKGIVTAREKDRLGAATRQGKKKDLKQGDLRKLWQSSLTQAETNAVRKVYRDRSRTIRIPPEGNERESAKHAIAHTFERQSAVPLRKLHELTLRHGVGSVTIAKVERELQRRIDGREVIARQVEGETHCTTRDVLREEQDMVAFAREGRNTCRPLHREAGKVHLGTLTAEQQKAVRTLLASTDRVMILRGRAGVGKTTLMREAVKAIDEGGRKAFVFAPSAQASRGVLRREGFTTAETVAKLLIDKELQKSVRGQVIWIDEAGLLGSRTMSQVFHLAEEANARVVLTGDPGQHASVDRGDALRLLTTRGGLNTLEVKTILRQRGTYRESIAELSEGNILAGFQKLDGMGALKELPAAERYAAMADEYISNIQAGRSVLAISPTHREGEMVSALIRKGLRTAGKIGPIGEERTIACLKAQAWTEAERSDARNYAPGASVQFHRHAKGFKLGERGDVVAADKEHVAIRKSDGNAELLPLNQSDRFQVYVASELRLAPGDLVRFTQNGTTVDRKHRLHNGSVQEVKGFTPAGDILLANGWTVAKDFAHLTHGYVSTSHAAQGKTVDRVLIAESADSFSAANREQFYVSVSRGRQSATIYTDDRKALLRAVEKSGRRISAMELVGEGNDPVRGQAHLVSRLAAQARTWASRQVEKITVAIQHPLSKAEQLLAKYGGPGLESAKVIGKANQDIVRKYGGPMANDKTQTQKGRIHERERD